MITFKQRCMKCKKNMVLVTSRTRYTICYDCQKSELAGKIKNPKMQKLFDIPEEFYKQSSFLRSVKANYLKFDSVSEKQIEYFKKTIEKMKLENNELR